MTTVTTRTTQQLNCPCCSSSSGSGSSSAEGPCCNGNIPTTLHATSTSAECAFLDFTDVVLNQTTTSPLTWSSSGLTDACAACPRAGITLTCLGDGSWGFGIGLDQSNGLPCPTGDVTINGYTLQCNPFRIVVSITINGIVGCCPSPTNVTVEYTA